MKNLADRFWVLLCQAVSSLRVLRGFSGRFFVFSGVVLLLLPLGTFSESGMAPRQLGVLGLSELAAASSPSSMSASEALNRFLSGDGVSSAESGRLVGYEGLSSGVSSVSAAAGVSGDAPEYVRGAGSSDTVLEGRSGDTDDLWGLGRRYAGRRVGRALNDTVDWGVGRVSGFLGGESLRLSSGLSYELGEGLTGDVELLWPLFRDDTGGWFLQSGLEIWRGVSGTRRHDLSVGVGRRLWQGEGSVLGLSLFYDHNLDEHHQRIGVGVDWQLPRSYGALNVYVPLTSWRGVGLEHLSGGLLVWKEERALGGMDVRFRHGLTEDLDVVGSLGLWEDRRSGSGVFERWSVRGGLGLEYALSPSLSMVARYEWLAGLDEARYEVGLDFEWPPSVGGGVSGGQVDLFAPVEREGRVLYSVRERRASVLPSCSSVRVEIGNGAEGRVFSVGDEVVFVGVLNGGERLACLGLPASLRVSNPIALVFRDTDGDGDYEGDETRAEARWVIPAPDSPEAEGLNYDEVAGRYVFDFQVEDSAPGTYVVSDVPPIFLSPAVFFGNRYVSAPYELTVAESSGRVLIPVMVSGLPQSSVSFQVMSGGNASVGVDYSVPDRVRFEPSGSRTQSLELLLTDDMLAEGDETVVLSLSAGSDDYNRLNEARITITSEEPVAGTDPVVLGFELVRSSRPYGGVDDLSYRVSGLRSGDRAEQVLSGDLSRVSGEDVGVYSVGFGTLSVSSQFSGRYVLPQALRLQYSILPVSITGLSGVVVVSRVVDGSRTATFDLSGATGEGVLAGELGDFRGGGLVVSGQFPAGAVDTAGVYDVPVSYSLADRVSFVSGNYRLAPGVESAVLQGTVTTGPVVGFARGVVSVDEGDSGSANLELTLNIAPPLTSASRVEVALAADSDGGTADATVTADYGSVVSPVVLPASTGSVVVSVPIVGDGLPERDEVFEVRLSAVGSAPYSLGTAVVVVTILNDDKIELTVTPDAPSRVYGGVDELSFTVGNLRTGDVQGSVVSGELSRAAGDNAGSYALMLGTVSVRAEFTDLYELPVAPEVTSYTITPVSITDVGGVVVVSRAYDGSRTATFDLSGATGVGVLAGELGDFRGGGLVVSGDFPSADAGALSVPVVYGLQNSGGFLAGNYSMGDTGDTLSGSITPVSITDVGGVVVVSRVVDGSRTATFDLSGATGEGVLAGELGDFRGGGLVVSGEFPAGAVDTAGTYDVPVTYSLADRVSFVSGNYRLAPGVESAVLRGTVTAAPVVGFARAAVSVDEGDSGSANLELTLNIAPPLTSASRVEVSLAADSDGGTADATVTEDYGSVVSPVELPANTGSVEVLVPIVGDTVPERDEVFEVRLSAVGSAPYSLGTAVVVVTILNDDKIELTVTPDAPSRVYGGVDELSFTVGNLRTGDAQGAVVSGELSRAAGDNAGSYALMLGTVSVVPEFTDLYELPVAPEVTSYTITPVSITGLSGVVVVSRVVDGSRTATFDLSGATGEGVLPDELGDFRGGGLVVSGQFPAGAVDTAGTYDVPVTYSLADRVSFVSGNYRLAPGVESAVLRGTVTAAPVVGFARAAVSVDEGDSGSANLELTLNIAPPLTSASSVEVALAADSDGGTADATVTADYGSVVSPVVLPANTGSVVISVPIVGDGLPERDEVFEVRLSAVGSAPYSLGTAVVVVTILNDDKIELTVTPDAPSRVYGGVDELSFTVGNLQAGDAQGSVVSGELSRAAGDNAGSYALMLGTVAVVPEFTDLYELPVAPAVTSYTITPVSITGLSGVVVVSRVVDGSRTATFDLSGATGEGVLAGELGDFRGGGLVVSGQFPAGAVDTAGVYDVPVSYSLVDRVSFVSGNYRLAPGVESAVLRGTVTAAPVVGFARAAVSVDEGDSGSANLELTLNIAPPLTSASSVEVALAADSDGGTADATVTADYGSVVSPVVLPANTGSVEVLVPIVGDGLPERDEVFEVRLSAVGSAPYSLGTAVVVVTILNDDKIELTVTPDAPSRVYGGVDELSFTVGNLRTGDAQGSVVSGELSRAAGDNAGSYALMLGTVAVVPEFTDLYELPVAPEVTSYTITPVSITDVGGVVVVSRVVDGSRTATFDLSGATGEGVLAGELGDFRGGGLVVSGQFPAGAVDTAGTYDVPVTYSLADRVSFVSGNYRLASGVESAVLRGTVTAAPVVGFARGAVSVDEGDSGSANLELTLNIAPPLTSASRVEVALAADSDGGTADATVTADYGSVVSPVVLPANTGSVVISVPIVGDGVPERDEVFEVRLSAVGSAPYSLGTAVVVVTILNDDKIELTVTPDAPSRVYGGVDELSFTVGNLRTGDAQGSVVSGELSRAAGDNAGSYALMLGTVSVVPEFTDLYELPVAPEVTSYTITPVSITGLSGVVVVSRVVDGSRTATFDLSGATGEGVLAGELGDFRGGGLVASGQFPAGAVDTAGTYDVPVTYSLADRVSFVSGNYRLAPGVESAVLRGTVTAAPVVGFARGAVSVDEGDGGSANLELTLNIAPPLTSASRVEVSLAADSDGGTADATATADYGSVVSPVELPASTGSVEVSVPIVGDGLPERDEVFEVRLSAVGSAPYSLGTAVVVVTILNDDKIELTVTPDAPSRVYGGVDDLSFTVGNLRTGDAQGAVVSGELSRAAGDNAGSYALMLGTVSVVPAFSSLYELPVAPEVTSYTITPVSITGLSGVVVVSRVVDGSRTATFDLSGATGAGVLAGELGDFRGGGLVASGQFPAGAVDTAGTYDVPVTYSLADRVSFVSGNYRLAPGVESAVLRGTVTAAPVVGFARGAVSVDEEDSGSANLELTLNIAPPLTSASRVEVALAADSDGGTADATATADYGSVVSPVELPASTGSVEVSVPIVGDGLPERDEVFEVRLSAVGSAPYSLGTAVVVVTILNDDKIELTVTPDAPSRVYGGVDDLSFTVGNLRTGDAQGSVVSGELSRAAGDNAGSYALMLGTVSVVPEFTDLYELPVAPEVTSYTITPVSITGLSGVVVVSRVVDGSRTATFDLSGATGEGVLAGELGDFRGGGLVASGQFPAGAVDTAGTYDVPVTYSLADRVSFVSGNYRLASGVESAVLRGTVTAAPVVGFARGAVSVDEGDGGSANLELTLNIAPPLTSASRVEVSLAADSDGGTADATATADYGSVVSPVELPASTGSVEVSVPIVGDGLPERDEVFEVRLSAVGSAPYSLGTAVVVVTILNDDKIELTVTPDAPSRVYGGVDDLSFTVGNLRTGDAQGSVVSGELSRAAGDNAGSYALMLGTVSVVPEFTDLYELPVAPEVTSYTITPVSITGLSGVVVVSRVVDGSRTATFDLSGATGAGVLAGELGDFRGGGLVASGQFPAGAVDTAGTYDVPVTYSLADRVSFVSGNYRLAPGVESAVLRGTVTAAPVVGFARGAVSVDEGDGGSANLELTLNIAPPLTSASRVEVSLAADSDGGTADATATADYGSVVSPVELPASTGSVEVSVPIVGDGLPERDEVFEVRLSAVGSAPYSLGTAVVVVTILNDDKIELTVTPDAPSRVYGGVDELSFTVGNLRTGDAQGSVVSGELSRAAGDNAGSYALMLGTVSVVPEFTDLYELPVAPEVTSYTITPVSITGLSGVVVVSRVVDGSRTATFDLSGATGAGVLAGELGDFRGGGLVASGQFPAGAVDTAGTYDVPVTYSLADRVSFVSGNYRLASGVESAVLRGTVTAAGTVTVGFSAPAYSVNEGEDLTVMVVATGRLAEDLVLDWVASDGTAAIGEDYGVAGEAMVSGTITLARGENSSVRFTIPTLRDGNNEVSETFELTLTKISGPDVRLGTATSTVTIVNVVATVPVIRLSSPAGATDARLTVIPRDARSPFQVFGFTASASIPMLNWPSDAQSCTTFDARSNGFCQTLVVSGPSQSVEQDGLTSGTRYLAWARGRGGLTSIPAMFTTAGAVLPIVGFDQASVSVVEGDSGTKDLQLVLNIVPPLASASNVQVALVADSASATADYGVVSSPVALPASTGSVAFSVPIAGDMEVERDEVFEVRLSAVRSAPYSLGTAVTVVTILNDDKIRLTVTPDAPSRVYGGVDDLSFTVGNLRTGDAQGAVVTGDLSRAAGDNAGSYALMLGTVSVRAGFKDLYELPPAPEVASYTITPAMITAVSGVMVMSREADRSRTATFDTSGAEGVGVLPAELGDFRGGGLVVSGAFPAEAVDMAGTYDVPVTYSLRDQGDFVSRNYDFVSGIQSAVLRGTLTAALPRGAEIQLGTLPDAVDETVATITIPVSLSRDTANDARVSISLIHSSPEDGFGFVAKDLLFAAADDATMVKNVVFSANVASELGADGLNLDNELVNSVERDLYVTVTYKPGQFTASEVFAASREERIIKVRDDEDPIMISFGLGRALGTAADFAVTYAESEGAVLIPITVTNLPASTEDFPLVIEGTARAGEDYEAVILPEVRFGPAFSSITSNIGITLIDDALVEGDETIRIRFGDFDGIGARYLKSNSAVITVTSEDQASDNSLRFLDTRYVVNESDGTLNLALALQRAASDTTPVSGTVSLTGTGVAGQFSSTSQTFSIPGDSSSATVSFTITGDDLVENDATFQAALSVSTAGFTVLPSGGMADVILEDDDSRVARIVFGTNTVLPVDYAANLNEAAGTTLQIPVTITHLPAVETDFALDFTGSTATSLASSLTGGRPGVVEDYTISPTILRFTSISRSKTQMIGIQAADDSIVEPNELIAMTFVDPTDPPAVLADHYARLNSARITLISDDVAVAAPVASLHGPTTLVQGSIWEGEVRLSTAPSSAVDVLWSVGSSTSDAVSRLYEVLSTTGRSFFAAGQTTQPIRIQTYRNGVDENQTLTISLSPGGGVNLSETLKSISVTVTPPAEVASVLSGTIRTTVTKLTGNNINLFIRYIQPDPEDWTPADELVVRPLDNQCGRVVRGGEGLRTANLALGMVLNCRFRATVERDGVVVHEGKEFVAFVSDATSDRLRLTGADVTVPDGLDRITVFVPYRLLGAGLMNGFVEADISLDATGVSNRNVTLSTVSPLRFSADNLNQEVAVLVTGTANLTEPQEFSVTLTPRNLEPFTRSVPGQGPANPSEYIPRAVVTLDQSVRVSSVSEVSWVEGSSDATVRIPLRLDRPAARSVSVAWSTVAGTATAGADFTAASGTVSFAAGMQRAEVSISLLQDDAVEGDEAFAVRFTPVAGRGLLDSQVFSTTVNIVDDDRKVTVGFSASTYSVNEGEDLTVMVATDGRLTEDLVFDWVADGGTATIGTDYGVAGESVVAGTITLAKGEGGVSFTIPTLRDGDTDDGETFQLSLTKVSGPDVSLGTTTSTVTISNTPTMLPTIRLFGDARTNDATFSVARMEALSPFWVFGFPASASVPVLDWPTDEQSCTTFDARANGFCQTLEVLRSSKLFTQFGLTSGTQYVVRARGSDDLTSLPVRFTTAGAPMPLVGLARDAVVGFARAAVSVDEGDSGSANLELTLNIAPPLTSASSVEVALAADSDSGTADATVTEDYGSVVSPVVLPASTGSVVLSVPIVGDGLPERDEVFEVRLSAVGSAPYSLGTAVVVVTILNDDKIELTVTPDAPSRVYGGVDDLSFTVGNLQAGDVQGAVVSGELSRAAGDNAGSYALTLGTVSVVPEFTDLYELPVAPAVTSYMITPVSITDVGGVVVVSRVVDGSRTATFDLSGATGEGVLAGELVDFRGGGLVASGEFPAGAVDTAGTYDVPVTYSLADRVSFVSGNYRLAPGVESAVLRGTVTAAPVVGFARAAVSVDEGDSGSANLELTLNIAPPLTSASRVEVSLAADSDGGTADATVTEDYGSVVSPVELPANTGSVEVLVPIVGDTVPERDEVFEVRLSAVGSAPYSLGTAVVVVTILNDDKIELTVTPDAPSRVYGGVDELSFTVGNLRTGDAQGAVVSGELSRAAGDNAGSYALTLGTVSVVPEFTDLYELPVAPEVTSYTITPVSITDVGGVVVVSRVVDGSRTATFDLSGATGEGVLAGELGDFRGGGLVVSGQFPAGAVDTAGVYDVPVSYSLADRVSFVSGNYRLAPGVESAVLRGTVMLAARPVVGFEQAVVSVDEGDSGTKNLELTLRVTPPLAMASSVVVSLAADSDGGTADATVTEDYGSVVSPVVLPASTGSVVLSVPIVGDTAIERDEVFEVRLSEVRSAPYTLLGDVVVVTILNDDKIELTVTPDAPSRVYGGVDDLSFTVGNLQAGDVQGSVVTGELSRAAGDNAGSYALMLGTVAVVPAFSSLYELPVAPEVTSYTITPVSITDVSEVLVVSRVVDGSRTATFDTSGAEGVGVFSTELSGFRSGGLVVSGEFPAGAVDTAGTYDVPVMYSLRDQGGFVARNYSFGSGVESDTLQGIVTGVPAVGFAQARVFVEEGDSGTKMVDLSLSITPPLTTASRVMVALAADSDGGTADAAATADYGVLSGPMVLPANTGSVVVSVPIVGDEVSERDEVFEVRLSAVGSAPYSLGTAVVVVTILNDDKIRLTVTPDAPSRVYGGVDDLSFTVGGLRTGDTQAAVVGGELSREPGENAGDYGLTLGTVVVRSAFADSYELPNDALSIQTYTITRVEITAVSGVTVVTRMVDGSRTATFDTSRAGGAGVLPDELSDFRSGGLVVSGQFPVEAETAAGTYDVPVMYSLRDQGGFVARNYSFGSRVDSDTLRGAIESGPVVGFAQAGVFVEEGDSGRKMVDLTLNIAPPLASASRVEVALAADSDGGTADATVTADYGSVVSPVVLPANTGSVVISVPIVGDGLPERDEVFEVRLSAVRGAPYSLGTAVVVVTILNDDKIELTITPDSPSRMYGEMDDLSFTVGNLRMGDAQSEVVSGTLFRAPFGNGLDPDGVGSYDLSLGTVSVRDEFADLYELPAAPEETSYTVTPRMITAVSGVTVMTREVNGFLEAAFDTSGATGAGVLPGEDLEGFRRRGLVATGSFSPDAAKNTVGTYDVTVQYSLTDQGAFYSENYRLAPDIVSGMLRGRLVAKVMVGFATGVVSVKEGDSGSQMVDLTLNIVPPLRVKSDVGFSIVAVHRISLSGTDGIATQIEDYGPVNGTYELPAGVSEVTVPIPIIGDRSPEPDEAFEIRLVPSFVPSIPVPYTLFPPLATVIILDDDKIPLEIALNQETRPYLGVAEDASFTVKGLQDGDTRAAVITGELSREPGENVGEYTVDLGSVSLTPAFSNLYELSLTTPKYTITPAEIIDIRHVRIEPLLAGGDLAATFDLRSVRAFVKPPTTPLQELPPQESADFRGGGLVVTGRFPSSQLGRHAVQATYALQDFGSFRADNYTLGARAMGPLFEDAQLVAELPRIVSWASESLLVEDVVEGEELELKIKINPPFLSTVTVPVSTDTFTSRRSPLGATTAQSGEDYNAPSSVTIAAGQSEASLRILIVDDDKQEGEEYFSVNLRPRAGYDYEVPNTLFYANVFIRESDRAPDAELSRIGFPSDSARVVEGDVPKILNDRQVAIVVNPPVTSPVTLRIDALQLRSSQLISSDSGVPATLYQDFALQQSRLTVPVDPSATTSQILPVPVRILGDTLPEPTEAFRLQISVIEEGTAVLNRPSIEVQIQDDDGGGQPQRSEGIGRLPVPEELSVVPLRDGGGSRGVDDGRAPAPLPFLSVPDLGQGGGVSRFPVPDNMLRPHVSDGLGRAPAPDKVSVAPVSNERSERSSDVGGGRAPERSRLLPVPDLGQGGGVPRFPVPDNMLRPHVSDGLGRAPAPDKVPVAPVSNERSERSSDVGGGRAPEPSRLLPVPDLHIGRSASRLPASG